MGVLIDASILIGIERGSLKLEEHLGGREDEEFFLSVITASELLHGVHRAGEPGIRTRRAAFVEGVLERFPILPVDVTAARAHARLSADLMAEGRIIGPHDLWISATCLAYGLGIVTANVREFARVPGLDVEEWK